MAMFTLASAASHWWVLALRGAVAILFGLAALFWPAATLAAVVLVYGAFAFADGILAVVAGARGRWGGLLLAGILGIIVGIIALIWPGITALALVFVIAAWAIVTGIMEIAAAVQLRREITGEWLLALVGVASLAFGILIALFPGAGALSILWVLGIYAIIYGVLQLFLGFRLRNLPSRLAARLG
ncbi:MAG TPA: DUF308 domain-containing protein [Gemmatimonadales bacterium]|nr:DUF308 domain-containing protein [Gemmatimonadales bacterium]